MLSTLPKGTIPMTWLGLEPQTFYTKVLNHQAREHNEITVRAQFLILKVSEKITQSQEEDVV